MNGIPQDSTLAFIVWLGTAPALQLVITRALPMLAWFRSLQATKKLVFVGILSILLPQLSLALTNTIPPETWALIDPNFRQLMISISVLLTWAAGEVGYQIAKRITEQREVA